MTTTAATTTTGTNCKCECGRTTASTYAPGHDAKHVSVLISYIEAGIITAEQAKAKLPSGALQVKLHNALARKARREEAKLIRQEAKRAVKVAKLIRQEAEKAAAKETEVQAPKYTKVKIGRWWYPVKEVSFSTDGTIAAVNYFAKNGEIRFVEVPADKLC